MDASAADLLLAFVRGVLGHELAGGEPPRRPQGFADRSHGGAFVTLHDRAGRLRGCMGTFHPGGTLLDTLESAARSATHDPRFQSHPVTGAELPDLRIEVSIVGVPQRTERPEALEIGRHGVWIRRGPSTGCFLPQVAVEKGWSAEEFLSQCCTMKAGLAPDAWKDPHTEVLLFEAEVVADLN